jgi:superfamily II DNA or RNA helicase
MTVATKPTTLELRPYQEEAMAAVNEAALDGVTRPLVALPTGTGDLPPENCTTWSESIR